MNKNYVMKNIGISLMYALIILFTIYNNIWNELNIFIFILSFFGFFYGIAEANKNITTNKIIDEDIYK